ERARRHVLLVTDRHALLHGAAQLEEALAQLVGGQLVDGPHAAVAEVVDVVNVALAGAQLDDVADRVEVVQRPQRHLGLGDVLVDLPVDAEAADLAQPVAVGVLELLAEQLLGLLQLRRVARTQALGDFQQRLLVRVGRVFLQRLEDQLVLELAEDRHFADGAGVEDVEPFLGQALAALDVDLARFGIDHVAGNDGAFLFFQAGAVGRRPLHVLGRVERLDDVEVGRVRRVHGAQERHRAELAGLVDADAERLLLGDVDLDPAAALGDDAAGVQLALAALGLDDEVDAGGAVQLADDDALRAVDDELAPPHHDRHVAHVYLPLTPLL